MTAEKLQLSQEKIIEKIYSFAKENKLSNDNVEPIPDGVYSAELYLSAPSQIMWILKEPYDDFNEKGEPYGGGWNLFSAFDNDNAWSSPTLQPIIYSMYGLFYNQKWDKMDEICNNKKMADVLKQIAYINISKMPASTTTNDNSLYEKYELWKEILMEQIAIYAPKIIIFGRTFEYFKTDLVGYDAVPRSSVEGVINIYEKNGVYYLDAYHPNQKKFSRGIYVNTIIESCLLK